MRSARLALAAGSCAALLCSLASASAAQERSRERAPIVRVYSQNGAVVSNYVTPTVGVSEDAYVFAVMMDLDGRVQVLHPEFPGISVRVRSDRQLALPNFFAGYTSPMQDAPRYTSRGVLTYDGYEDLGNDTRGTVIALASRAPFKLGLIEAGGDWNISQIRLLIEHRTPSSAAQALAQYIGAKGESVGRDYMRFAGQRQSYYAYDEFAYCGYGYGSSYRGVDRALTFARAGQLRSVGLRPVFLGYDACGLPVIAVAPFSGGGGIVLPPNRLPRRDTPNRLPRRDTTVFPKSRFPGGIAHHPSSEDGTPKPVPVGIFPLPQRSESQRRDATIPAPQARRSEPREMPDQFRSRPGTSSFPSRLPPVEHTAPPRAEPAAIGAFPIRRAEPRVIAPPPPPPPSKTAPSAPPPKQQ
jgi:hypothetical protein